MNERAMCVFTIAFSIAADIVVGAKSTKTQMENTTRNAGMSNIFLVPNSFIDFKCSRSNIYFAHSKCSGIFSIFSLQIRTNAMPDCSKRGCRIKLTAIYSSNHHL